MFCLLVRCSTKSRSPTKVQTELGEERLASFLILECIYPNKGHSLRSCPDRATRDQMMEEVFSIFSLPVSQTGPKRTEPLMKDPSPQLPWVK